MHSIKVKRLRHWRIWILVLLLLFLPLLFNVLLWRMSWTENGVFCALCSDECSFSLFSCVVCFLSLISSHTVSSCFMFCHATYASSVLCFVRLLFAHKYTLSNIVEVFVEFKQNETKMQKMNCESSETCTQHSIDFIGINYVWLNWAHSIKSKCIWVASVYETKSYA